MFINCNVGVPTSTVNSTQQWDYPNCWPPLQAMVIQGLGTSSYILAQKAAINLAKSWIDTNYKGFMESGTMFEKVIFCNNYTVFQSIELVLLTRKILTVVV